MKFSCHRCKTRYSIADEKVQGKILKVRCKKCSELIVVRERTLTSPNELERGGSGLLKVGRTGAPPRSAPPTPPPAPEREVEWFYAVQGRTAGPLSEAALAERLRNGVVPRTAHAWREGLGVWRSVVDLPDLRMHLPAVPAVPPAPPPASPPAPPQARGAWTGLAGQPGPVATGEQGSVAAPPAFGPRLRPPGQLATPHGGHAPAVGNGRGGFEDSAASLPSLEDLAGLIGADPTMRNEVSVTVPPPAGPIGGPTARHLTPSAPRARVAPPGRDDLGRRLLYVGVPALLGAVVLAIVISRVVGDESLDPADMAEVETRIVPSVPEEVAPDPAPVAAAEPQEFTFEGDDLWADEPDTPVAAPTGQRRLVSDAPRGRPERLVEGGAVADASPAHRRLPTMGSVGGMTKDGSGLGGRLQAIGRDAAEAHLPPSLGPTEIKLVIKRQRNGLKQCLERHLKKEGSDSVGNQKVVISWMIPRSGRPEGISLSNGMRDSVFGKCVEGQIANWHFPQHRGAPVPVNYPVILTASP